MRGYRGTRAQWDAERERRDGYSPGRVYGPDVRPRQPKYSVVMWDEDVATSFTLNFPPDTTLQQAQEEALAEMPENAFIAQTREDRGTGVTAGVGGTKVLPDGYWPYVAFKFEPGSRDVRWAGFGTYTDGQLPPP
jgi:hypothetical protein